MSLIFTKRFKKTYQKLPQNIQRKVKKALRLLAENPRHSSLRIKRIQGTEKIYEGRIDLKYRFSFEFDNEDILLRNIDNHDECLKNP
jgi:mRNA-degrading endonuclease RelE of RelBE toxin-antitoxin system